MPAAIAAKVSELSCAPVFCSYCSYCSTSEIENTKYVPEFSAFQKFIPPKSLNLGTNAIGQFEQRLYLDAFVRTTQPREDGHHSSSITVIYLLDFG